MRFLKGLGFWRLFLPAWPEERARVVFQRILPVHHAVHVSLRSCRLDAFAQLDVRVDKNYYFRGWRLGIYLDLQNVTKSVLRQQDVLMSTGVIENPEAPAAEQRYVMKRLKQESGTLLPTIGLTVEF